MSNAGTCRMSLLTVEGAPADAPGTRVTVRRVSDGTAIRSFKLAFPPSHDLLLPAFPQEKMLAVFVEPRRFRARWLSPFMLIDGKTIERTVTLFRDPRKWSARFTSWSSLSDRFDLLREVLENSPGIDVIGGPSLATMADGGYDGIDSAAVVTTLSKASLLNLYTKLSELREPLFKRKAWFGFVERLLRIGRERLVAVVDVELAARVRAIKDDIGAFPDYKHAPAGDHWKNFPLAYAVPKGRLFSVKTAEDQGNLQLTVGPGKDPETGRTVWLLDADIDENGMLMAHLGDLFRHKITGGTHPFDVHEYLRLTYRHIDLGYELKTST